MKIALIILSVCAFIQWFHLATHSNEVESKRELLFWSIPGSLIGMTVVLPFYILWFVFRRWRELSREESKR